MSDYRRWFVAGGTYFFTIKTHDNRPVLETDLARSLLRQSLQAVRQSHPFTIVAIALMPNHLHTVWTLPLNDSDYSTRIRRVKGLFTQKYIASGGREGRVGASHRRRRERGIWQRRFWEHTCRDEDDLKRCVDYVHWNPVKHGLVARVRDYPWSSFHRFVTMGEYDEDWGGTNPCANWNPPE